MDWGRRRFGVALSDPGRLFAQPVTTLSRRERQRPPYTALLELIRTHEVSELVVGLPLTPEGEEAAAAAEARSFGETLARRAGLPVTFHDERMSTALALRAARTAGVRDRDSRSRIDEMAAVAILQHVLDLRRAQVAAGTEGTGGAR